MINNKTFSSPDLRNSWLQEIDILLQLCIKKPEYSTLTTLSKIKEYLSLEQEFINNLVKKAESLPRLRFLETIHTLNPDNTSDSPTNAMFNCFLKDTYVCPHQHKDKNEYFYILQGELAIILYDRSFNISEIIRLSQNSIYTVPPEILHTVVCLTRDAFVLELKDKPYNPKTDKAFGEVFPAETYIDGKINPQAREYLNKLKHNILSQD